MSSSPNLRLARLSVANARRPWIVDAATAGGIIALASLRGPGGAGPTAGWAFSVALALPLLGRRRWPTGVFAVVAAVAFGQWLAGVRAFGDVALLVALYTVAARRPLRTTLAAAAVLEIGVALAVARWAPHAVGPAFVALSGLATAAGVLGVNVRHRQALLASLQERAARLEHERDQQGQLAAAAERARIAREMHDIVAHNLSVMIALADGATFAVHDAPERAESAMRSASRTGRQALTEMRRLLGVLREDREAADRTPQPGVGQLEELVEQVRAAGVPTALQITGSPPADVPAGLQLAAYRIVQEALTNTLKHAGLGVAATVSLRWTADRLAVEVRDTGVPASAPAQEGGGLRGMRERAGVYDGSVEAGAGPGGGWRVRTELAYAAAAAPPVGTPA